METPISMNFDELEGVLRPLIVQQLKDQGYSGDTCIGSRQDMDLDPVFSSLRKLIPSSSDEGLQLPGVPLPEVDEQLGPIQQEVEAVLQRLAGHRKEVPAVMGTALEQQLRAIRPKDPQQGQVADASCDASVAEADQEKQLNEAQRLHHIIKETVNKLPALRARLEEMSERLDRNLTAVGAVQATATQPPRTVERVLRSVAAGRGHTAAADTQPAAAE